MVNLYDLIILTVPLAWLTIIYAVFTTDILLGVEAVMWLGGVFSVFYYGALG